MNITTEHAKKGIQERLESLQGINALESFRLWHDTTCLFVARIYGEDSLNYRQIKSNIKTVGQNMYEFSVSKSKNDLEGFLSEIEVFGLPPKIENKKEVQNQFNLSQSQQQQQTQNIERTIEQAVQELPEGLVERIKKIVAEGGPRTTMMQRIFDDLKNLEIGTAASVLSTILTNFYLRTMG